MTNERRGTDAQTSGLSRRRLLQSGAVFGLGTATGVGVNAAQASPGDVIWEFEAADDLRRPPTVVDGTAFVHSSQHIYAVDATTGTERWSYENFGYLGPRPTVVDGLVFLGDTNSRPVALDATSGTEAWSVDTDVRVAGCHGVVDGTVIVEDIQNNIYGLGITDGAERWRFERENNQQVGPLFDGDTLYLMAGNSLYALDIATGSELWVYEADEKIQQGPTVADGSLFVGSNRGPFVALDKTNGDERWTVERPTNPFWWSVPTVADGSVYVGTSNNTVFAFDGSNGAEVWGRETKISSANSPTIAGDTLFYRHGYNEVVAADAGTGERTWSFEVDGLTSFVPLVVDGMVVFNVGKKLVAIDAGIVGSSEGSRSWLGREGYHDDWQYADMTVSFGQQSADSAVTTDEFDDRTETSATVTGARAGESTTIELDLSVSSLLTIEELVVTLAVDADLSLTITSSNDPLESTPEVPMLASDERLGFLRIDSSVANEDVEEVIFRYSVDSDSAESLANTPEEMALYRHETDHWAGYLTALLDQQEDTLRYETTAPGFSEWTAGASRPDISITDATVDVSTVETGEAFDIDVTLTNPDEASDIFVTELLFEGEVVERQRPRVPAEASIIATFTRDVKQEGEYTVQVNDVEVGTVTVSDGSVTGGGGGEADQDDSAGSNGESSEFWPWVVGGIGTLGGGYAFKRYQSRSGDEGS